MNLKRRTLMEKPRQSIPLDVSMKEIDSRVIIPWAEVLPMFLLFGGLKGLVVILAVLYAIAWFFQ